VTVAAAAVFGAASLLLLAAGGAKVVDPTRTAGALATLGWGVPPVSVRVGAVAEALLGALGLVVGGPVVAALVAFSFAGFAVFVALALASGTPVGTCGCFGRADTPPRPVHVAVDAVLAAGALLAAAIDPVALLDAPPVAWPLAVAAAAAAYVVLTRGATPSGAPPGRAGPGAG
jgi:hypothetical protein